VNRYHDVRQLAKDELERAKRELQANLEAVSTAKWSAGERGRGRSEQ